MKNYKSIKVQAEFHISVLEDWMIKQDEHGNDVIQALNGKFYSISQLLENCNSLKVNMIDEGIYDKKQVDFDDIVKRLVEKEQFLETHTYDEWIEKNGFGFILSPKLTYMYGKDFVPKVKEKAEQILGRKLTESKKITKEELEELKIK